MSRGWMYDPHSGGRKIPDPSQERIRSRILAHANKTYAGKFDRIDVRFRGQFCYVDAYIEPFVPEPFDAELYGETRESRINRLRNTPMHLCRLQYFGSEDSLSMAFFAYSSEKYEPCVFGNGGMTGTPEEAFDTAAVYLIS